MEKLKENWITQSPLDFEYNQYTLMAYLMEANKEFRKTKIYPVLDELEWQVAELQTLRKNTRKLREAFPKKLSKLDVINQHLIYEEMLDVDKYIEHVERTVDFAIPKIEGISSEGKEIYSFVKEQCVLEPIGMLPLHVKEGYLFVAVDTTMDTSIYQYSLGLFESDKKTVPAVHVKLIEKIKKARTETFEFLKRKMIKKFKNMPNPATYLFQVRMSFPFEETVLPIAREFLVKYISRA